MADTPTQDTDYDATLADVRRSLEDLLAFEGRYFVVPEEASTPDVAVTPVVDGDDLDLFRQNISDCLNCQLGHTRKNFVFGSGNRDADIMFVGEAPGQEEDRQGQPFVGPAGELLTKIIGAMQMSRDDVYICNVLKCRPPNNRDPQPEEVASCEPYLQRQIELVRPRVICCLGRHAAHALLKTELSLSRLRGALHQYQGIPLVVTYHPAALLRNAGYKRAAWDDVKWVRRLHDGRQL
ncbi:MAG: uracil-DNA glycosylase [Candidatus Latescibacteria bacterium]|jgi:DNA polymerase|nr:hypothetical protein [Gemmatimonadaceae bacterium]MDP6017581.1 uracil-DNA glycosylase [Candidatus Latescibacterota bacterium]MDP7447688.1 uracil-DNA glycosylase [Candidatus Latescibacterota bacterium]HJP32325.1 uracil-DNA glycosylase [Candidatus Latescibacterota bacterium]|tara:strand:- start:721 stop:1431 length:711 start_codon:yes stop_codon:yes gene_type:complete